MAHETVLYTKKLIGVKQFFDGALLVRETSRVTMDLATGVGFPWYALKFVAWGKTYPIHILFTHPHYREKKSGYMFLVFVSVAYF